MGDFPTAENEGYFRLVSFLKEAPHVLDLELEIVLVGLRAELNLLELHLNLFLFCLLHLLALLILEFAEVHDPANRRNRSGRNFDKIELLAFGKRQCFAKGQDTELFTVGPDYPDLSRLYCLVDVNCRFSYDATSLVKAVDFVLYMANELFDGHWLKILSVPEPRCDGSRLHFLISDYEHVWDLL